MSFFDFLSGFGSVLDIGAAFREPPRRRTPKRFTLPPEGTIEEDFTRVFEDMGEAWRGATKEDGWKE